MSYILVLDIGTTNIKAFLFDKKGEIIAQTTRRPKYILDEPGQVEQDPKEIWEMSSQVIEEVLETKSLKADDIDSLGITTQRGSFLLWNKSTGEPYTNIITWQDTRSAEFAKKTSKKFKFKAVRGLMRVLTKISSNPFFVTASQLRFNPEYASASTGFLLETNPELKKIVEKEDTAWGTIDSWILWNITGGKVHATDCTNASSTGLLDPFKLVWNSIIYKTFKIPIHILPEVKATRGNFGNTTLFGGGEIPINSVMADQQASLFALFSGAPKVGDVKCTNGTGTFVDIFTGEKAKASKRKLYPLVAWGINDEEGNIKAYYLLEGLSHNTGNIVDYIGSELGFYSEPAETETMAISVADSKEPIFFVPSLTSGLSFPWWDETSKAAIFGISLSTKKEHIVKAVLEGICYRIKDIVEGVIKDTKIELKQIKLDGGVSQNKYVLQFLSDILGIEVEHSGNPETTALGTAFMAGLESGFWKSPEELKTITKVDKIYTPQLTEKERKVKYDFWKNIISRSLNYMK
jgi:glycerol kinase